MISEYFEENNLFNQNQYGFRPGHSTEHAALELVDKITSQMDNNETPINIFFLTFLRLLIGLLLIIIYCLTS